MKIEVEIDEKKVFDAVVTKISENLMYEAKHMVEQTVKAQIRDALQRRAREHVDELLKDFKLPDGRTFKEYVENLLWAPSRKPGHELPWNERPALMRAMEERLWRETQSMFNEIAKPALDDLKKRLRERLVAEIIS